MAETLKLDFSKMTEEEAVKELEKAGFYKINKEIIHGFVMAYHADEDRSWIKDAYIMKPKKISQPVRTADGEVLMTVDKNGKPIEKKKFIKLEEQHKVFDIITAKKLFCEKYVPNIAPQEKKEKEKDIFEDWF